MTLNYVLMMMGKIAMYFANNSLNTLSHLGFYQLEMEEENNDSIDKNMN